LPFEGGNAEARPERAGPRRVFLDWKRPILHSAARWILAELGHELGDVLVAVPAARAAARLRELLALAAPPAWTPPRVLTQGELIDELVQLERPAAGRLVRTLVWARALAELDEGERAALQRRRGGGSGEPLRLAETVRTLHGTLAPEGRDFASLAKEPWGDALDGEAARWRALGQAQAHYRKRLARLGLVDPHEGRGHAITNGAVDRARRVVLVAVADMNHLLARLVAALGDTATALVAAPEELAAGFDELGRLRPAFWCARDVPLALEEWRVAEKPVDQGEALRAALDEWHGEYSPAELTVGVADESVVPYLERQLDDCGVRARRAAGTPLERARPLRLLRALARYLARRGFAELAALARDPDLAAALGGDPDVPARFDRYHREHLPRQAQDWLGTEPFEEAVRAYHELLERSLGPLAAREARPPAEWAGPIRAWLEGVYSGALDETVEPQRQLAEALRGIGAALGELEQVPAGLELALLGAADALELVLRALRGQRVPPPPMQDGVVELLGWLDLALDDAPALVLTGFNEDRIPQSVGADAFLPDTRRAALGLPGNAERLARDVHATCVILATRERKVFVSARRSAEGDPLAPSRLAFHRPASEVPARVARFLSRDQAHPRLADDEGSGRSYACPLLPGWVAPGKLRVSAFRAYLSSPYLFYLEHVLGLETIDDRLGELDPRRFGTLAHAVLEDLGAGPHDSSDPELVARFLVERLRARAAAAFGPSPLPAVELQVEQLAHRLRVFAHKQAARAAEGWRIHAVEWKPPEPVFLDVDGRPLQVSGKLDRVDRHPDGRWAILDYKTGERRRTPREAHRKKDKDKTWLDLQLPLYRLLAKDLGLAGEPELGYAWIGKEEHDTDFFPGDFAPAELEEALEEARRIVRCVRAGDFATPGRTPYDEIFKAIFGLSTLGGESEELAP
jgi:hypothetical protein